MVDFDVVSLPETDHVAEGDAAPDFTRPLVGEEYWEDRALSEAVDGPTLLLFHPMDGAFQATYLYNTTTTTAGPTTWTLGVSISTPYAPTSACSPSAPPTASGSSPTPART